MTIFTDVVVNKPRRSKKVLDHPYITTTDFGKIIPVLLEDVIPGDVFKCKSAVQLKLLPTLAPLMTGIEVRLDYFFVPNRLVWDNWEKFITGGEDGTDEPVKPVVSPNYSDIDNGVGSLWDYFGLPPTIPANVRGNDEDLITNSEVSALPFRAYNLIWNEYYRDQNLQSEDTFEHGDGPDHYTPCYLKYRDLKKDYFTSALPWAQRGPSVEIPVGDTAPVTGSGSINIGGVTLNSSQYKQPGSLGDLEDGEAHFVNGTLKSVDTQLGTSQTASHYHNMEVRGNFNVSGTADLSSATGITINELRRLTAVQRWLERNARAGSRYVEQILAHFGVRVPDYRLQRPEYLGGEKQIIGMAEVLQTSETANSPQGTRAGVGFGNMLAKSRKYFVQEHGMIMCLMSIIPASNLYGDGVQRRWLRNSKFDYFFTEFQRLGEQAIYQEELFAYNAQPEALKQTFGYTPRYAEYMYHPGEITGQMRTTQAYWHLGRLFNERPYLNQDFVSTSYALQQDQYDRIFPTDVDLGDRFSVIIQHFERLKRPMVKNPSPL